MAPDADELRKLLEQQLSDCADVTFQRIDEPGGSTAWIVFVPSMVDRPLLDRCLDRLSAIDDAPPLLRERRIRLLQAYGEVQEDGDVGRLASAALSGGIVLLFGDGGFAAVTGLEQRPTRSIEEPDAEPLVRGPREGFIESLETNLALVRKRLPTPALKIETRTIGKYTRTKVAIVYLDGVAADSIVKEARKRIDGIAIDGVIDAGYIEEWIEDTPYSPFPQVQNTERPDIASAALLEGKIALLVEGSPGALIVPLTFWSAMQSGEDYYERFILGTFVRWIRLLFLMMALFLPSVYVAISTYHPEMIPTNLLVSIAGAREANPFPALVEALLMEITFEALREAGERLPKQVGAAVSIVGALVIGQAAVEAGIVSAPMVIVVAITGIASFTIPRFNLALSIRLLRFPMIVLGGTLGLYGISIGFLGLLVHLNSLRSFGVPYMQPVSPLYPQGLKDVFVRAPHWAMYRRPKLASRFNRLRIPKGQKPGPKRT